MNQKQKSPFLNFTKDKMALVSVILLGVAVLLLAYQALASIASTFNYLSYLFESFHFNVGWIWSQVIVWFWNAFVVVLLWDIAYLALPAGIVLRDFHEKINLIFPVALFLFGGLSFFGMFGSTFSVFLPGFLVGFGQVIDALVTTAGFTILGLHYLMKGEKITKLFKWIALGVLALFHGLDYLFAVIELIARNLRWGTGVFSGLVQWFNTSVSFLPLLLVLVAVFFYNPFKDETPVPAQEAPVEELSEQA